jgi:hypothetical protein
MKDSKIYMGYMVLQHYVKTNTGIIMARTSDLLISGINAGKRYDSDISHL